MTKSICPVFETLKSENGVVEHLYFHQQRFEKTRKELYGRSDKITLSSLLKPPKEGIHRIRVEYAEEILKIEYIPYAPKEWKTFCVVEATLDYAYKWSNREAINALLQKSYDDIIITQDGMLQDTSIANIAVYSKGRWRTPKTPLLKGTTRQRLIESGFLCEELLDIADIKKMEKFAIMNALIGFKIVNDVQIGRIEH